MAGAVTVGEATDAEGLDRASFSMTFPLWPLRSWAGGLLTVVYLGVAIFMAQDEIRHSGGGWINLRGLGTNILTSPSQLTIGTLLESLGVKKINYNDPGAADYAQLTLHILVTAALFYLIGWGGEWLVRRIIGHPPSP